MSKDVRKCILGPFLQIFIYRAKWLIWTIKRKVHRKWTSGVGDSGWKMCTWNEPRAKYVKFIADSGTTVARR